VLRLLAAFGFGLLMGERRAAEPRSGASGWLAAFLIFIAILAWGHVGFSPTYKGVGSTPAAFSTRLAQTPPLRTNARQ
jgi:hypothetical protein